MSQFSQTNPIEPEPIAAEVVSDTEYQQVLDQQRQIAEEDKIAREQARKILQRYEEGFTPNLIQDSRLSAFDSLTASRVILQLLRLSLGEDQDCAVGEPRLTYLRGRNLAIAQQCGQVLYQLGGTRLMDKIIKRLIPAFDRENLSQAWQGIGAWSAFPIKSSAADRLPRQTSAEL